jgi:hypothetical protein
VSEDLEVRTHAGSSGVYATRGFDRGDEVFRLTGSVGPGPSRYSIQIGVDRHLEPYDGGNGAPASRSTSWKYLNHSCDPNLQVDPSATRFLARHDIAADDELSFNYLTTEWEMATPFDCRCGSVHCFGHIAGFKHLTPRQQQALLGETAAHIKACLDLADQR